MTFWIFCLVLLLVVAVPLTWVILRRKADTLEAADFDIAVYRDQLRDIDRDLARGVIGSDVAERTRLEISRRILAADKARQSSTIATAPKNATITVVAALMIVLVGGSLLTYQTLGSPGYADLPLQKRLESAAELRENRPNQLQAEANITLPPLPEPDAEYLALVDRLREKVAEQPDDLRGLQLLAQNEGNLGNFGAAYQAQSKLLDVIGDQAPAEAYAELAEFYILAAGGYVSPEAEAALVKALERDPHNGPARYYSGLIHAQTGRPDLAFQIWQSLLEQSAADAPWVAAIRAQIPRAAAQAGIDYTLPPVGPAPLAGPSAGDMAAAQDMSAEDRQAMIESMVENLAERLATDGGSAAEWARLIGALGVLGQTERAAAIFAEAQGVFSQDPNGLAAIHGAAVQAGIAE